MHNVVGVDTAVKHFREADYLGILSLKGIWNIATTPVRRVKSELGKAILGECIWVVKPYKKHKGAIVLAYKKSTRILTVSGSDIEAQYAKHIAKELGLTFEAGDGVNPAKEPEEFNLIVGSD